MVWLLRGAGFCQAFRPSGKRIDCLAAGGRGGSSVPGGGVQAAEAEGGTTGAAQAQATTRTTLEAARPEAAARGLGRSMPWVALAAHRFDGWFRLRGAAEGRRDGGEERAGGADAPEPGGCARRESERAGLSGEGVPPGLALVCCESRSGSVEGARLRTRPEGRGGAARRRARGAGRRGWLDWWRPVGGRACPWPCRGRGACFSSTDRRGRE